MLLIYSSVINFSKPLTSATNANFHNTSRISLLCNTLGRDWLLMQSSVAGATFLNEFGPYAMQALPLVRRTCQRFTGIDYNWQTQVLHSALINNIQQKQYIINDCLETDVWAIFTIDMLLCYMLFIVFFYVIDRCGYTGY